MNEKVRIVHVMANGTIRNSVKGLKVPKDNQAYCILEQLKGSSK